MSTRQLQLGGGRPPTPTAHKRLAGTLRGDRQNPGEPQVTAIDLPDAPADLTPDERAAWVELAHVINPMSIAAASDVFAFRQMVEDVAMLMSLRRSLIESGGRPVVIERSKGGVHLRTRPELAAIPVFRKLVLLHMSRWGLSPADRQRVSALQDESRENDSLSEFRIQ